MHPLKAPTAELSPAMTDQEAIREVISGHREMFEVIVRRYNQQLYRVGQAYLKSHDQTEDAMQNTYLKAFLNLPSFHGTAAFSTWLTRIMINECLMLLRKRKNEVEDSLDGNAPISISDPNTRHAATNLNQQEIKLLLEKTIDELPRKYRTVYLLREVQQMSTDETAQALGMSEENVKVSLHRAREMLKERLLKSGAGLELFPYHAPFCNRLTAQVMKAILAAPAPAP